MRKMSRKRTSKLTSRTLRTARAEMAATLGFISLAVATQGIRTNQRPPSHKIKGPI